MTHDEMIEVIQAHRDGKQIQCKNRHDRSPWRNVPTPVWNFAKCEYRVKPEPREWRIAVRKDGGAINLLKVGDGCNDAWEAVTVREVIEQGGD